MRNELFSAFASVWKGLPLCAALAVLSNSAQAIVLDDFTGDLSNYTATVINDTDDGGSNGSTWTIDNQQLSLVTTAYEAIEQHAFIYDGASLDIGQELQMDISSIPITGNRNLGLYVGGTAPTFDVREDYIAVYAQDSNNNISSRGFDGNTEYELEVANVMSADMLYIARTADNTFEAGYYDGLIKNVISTRTPTTPNSADFIGFYADVRAVGTIGFADNLEIFPDVVFDPADVNEDGAIDENDYFIIRDNLYETEILGLPVVKGDGDIVANGIVDLADFRFWKDSAPPAALLAAGLAAPEPSGLALALFGAISIAGRLRSRR